MSEGPGSSLRWSRGASAGVCAGDTGLHFDGIDIAVSVDQGRTWKIDQRIITSPYGTNRGNTSAFPQQTYNYGDGDPRLVVDAASGYFYVFYGSRIVNKAGGWVAFHAHVARAPISGKMAPGTWQKWYGGQWSQPGVGGLESNMVPVTSSNPNGYTPVNAEYSPSTPVYATDDLTSQKWTLIGDTGSYKNASWYRWFLDPVSKTSSAIVGKNFRMYCSFGCSGGRSGEYVNVSINWPRCDTRSQCNRNVSDQQWRTAPRSVCGRLVSNVNDC